MSMPHLRSTLTPLALVTLLLSGCGLSFDKEEIHLRLRPGQDRLDALMIYRGAAPMSASRQSLEESVETAGAVINGSRVFPLLGPIVFDLEETDDDLTPEQAAILACIQVDQAGALLDETDRLCLYQKAHIDRLGFVIDALNRTISQGLLARASEQAASGKKDDDDLDERTRALWLAKARRQEPWVRLAGGAIEIDLPLSNTGRHHALDSLLTGLTTSPDREELADWISQLSRTVDRITYSDERLVIRLGSARGDLLHVTLKGDRQQKRPSDEPLLEALAEAGHRPDPDLTLAAVRTLLADPD